MPLAWNDDRWVLATEQPTFACAPPYIGNGRLGLRLGALVLGTDITAPRLTGAGPEQTFLAVPRFDHSWPLQAFAAHARDGFQHSLPSWAQLQLRIGADEFRPGAVIARSGSPLTSSLDLRTGEAALDGTWMVDGGAVDVRIRVLVPRSLPHGGLWQLELDGLPDAAELSFGLDGRHLADDLDQHYEVDSGDIIGRLRTTGRGREIVTGLRWRIDGAETESVTLDGHSGTVQLTSAGSTLRLSVGFACHGGTESGGVTEVQRDLATIESGLADGSLRRDNERQWRELWSQALDVTALPLPDADRSLILAQQFYLLASYDGAANPVAPLGLSGNQWGGAHMWDADLWHGRALAVLWPDLGRQIVRARLRMLPVARQYALDTGFTGARFGWMSDEDGNEQAPPGPYREELHVNAWVMLHAWHLWRATGDRAVLDEAWPLLSEVAQFWCSRAERDADGSWHLRGVLGPDEAVHENPRNIQLCDDNVLTNVAVRAALRATTQAAHILRKNDDPRWAEVADRLVVLPAGPDGVIPEYDGYRGHEIKQADLILAFFPLGLPLPPEQIVANLDYYHDRVGAGPLMTEQIEAAIRLRTGRHDKSAVLRDLVRAYRRSVHGVFEAPYEVACNSNSLMLTACGGLIAALTCGWWDYREPGDDAAAIPRLLDDAEWVGHP